MAGKETTTRGDVETEVKVGVSEQDYSDAWDQANKEIGETDRPALSAADDPANAKEEVVEEKKEEIPVEPIEELKPTDQQPGESDEKYEQRYKTLQGIHRHDKELWDAEKVTLLAQIEEAKKPKEVTKEETVAAEVFVDSLTDEQKEQLADYEQDFDVVSKMEGIKRNVELVKLRKEIDDWKTDIVNQFTEAKTQFASQLAPAVKLAEDSERESHFSLIREGYDLEDGTHISGHTDFEKFRDDGSLLSWIESKPRYIQPILKETYEKGTAMDVIDLIADFKHETNIQPSDNVVPINTKKAEKKAALTSVTSRRGAINTGHAIAGNYEDAWDEAISKQGG